MPCSIALGSYAISSGGPRGSVLPGGCAGNERRRLARLSGVAPARTHRCSKPAPHRIRCKSTPRYRSAGSCIPGTSSRTPQCHPRQGLDNAVPRVHKRAVELPLARTAPKARGRPQNLSPGPSLLRRQALRITKMRDIANNAMPRINRPRRQMPATASNPLSRNADLYPLTQGGLFLASKTGLILDSAPAFRHAAGVMLVSSGTDVTVIRSFLGHENLDTTNLYARANLETKRQALERASASARPGKPPRWRRDPELLTWLDSL